MLPVTVDPASGTPPFEQLRRQVAAMVAEGSLSPGSRMPTVRRLAADLGLAANTVARAYRELETDGVIATHGRKGTFVWIGLIRLVALPALFLLLPTADSIMMVGVYAVLLSALGSAGYAPILIFLNERFPTSIRATGTGLSWNIGFAIGGMMPTAVSLVAKDASQLPMTLAIFIGAISVIFLVGAFVVPETLGKLEGGSARSPS